MAAIIFDIETGPLDRETVLSLVDPFPPFVAPAPWVEPPPFDPANVKLGNTTDKEKIAAKVEAAANKYAADQAKAKAEHVARVASADADYAAAKLAYEEEKMNKAALSALTGQVLAIGYYGADSGNITVEMSGHEGFDERSLLQRFWKRWLHYQTINQREEDRRIKRQAGPASLWIGHNVLGFDVPFLVQRSIIQGVTVPSGVVTSYRGKIGLHEGFLDTMLFWGCGNYRAPWVSLDKLGVALECGSKADCTMVNQEGETVPVGGGDFHKLLASHPGKAAEYLANDLKVTMGVAQRLGVV